MKLAHQLVVCLSIAAGALVSCTLLLDDDLAGGTDPPPIPDATAPVDSPVVESDGGFPAEIGNGTGRNGPLVVSGEQKVNAYAALQADVTAGSTSIETAGPTGWGADDVVLVWETTGLTLPASTSEEPIDAKPLTVGRYELVRLRAVTGSKLELARPLAHAFRAGAGQVVRVPEHTDVTIPPGAVLRADPWDGTRGGVVALLATGKIQLDGVIDVDARGFRGGRGYLNGGLIGCLALEGKPRDGYGAKGEGLTPSGYGGLGDAGDSPGGRSVHTNGGGGGNCHNAGAGGGGNGGNGGRGGRAYYDLGGEDNGGYGGRAIVFTPATQLVLGGGGGSGDADDTPGETPGIGANGGGAVLLRASLILVNGNLTARGAEAASIASNGGGGGGAGGTIALFGTTRIACSGTVAATGGKGGSVTLRKGMGPGGGGGGGFVSLQSPAIECVPDVSPGESGTTTPVDGGLGPSYGATNGIAGKVVTSP